MRISFQDAAPSLLCLLFIHPSFLGVLILLSNWTSTRIRQGVSERRNHASIVPTERRLIKFGARHNGSRDDGFIYLTYVDNLVRNGVGAVFNADEYVEGYTSVAWLGLLSIARAFSDLLSSSASLRQLTLLLSHGLSLTALVLVLEINRSAVVRAVGNDKDRLGFENINLPLVFIVGTRAVHQFASSGLETPLVLVFSGSSSAAAPDPEPRDRVAKHPCRRRSPYSTRPRSSQRRDSSSRFLSRKPKDSAPRGGGRDHTQLDGGDDAGVVVRVDTAQHLLRQNRYRQSATSRHLLPL